MTPWTHAGRVRESLMDSPGGSSIAALLAGLSAATLLGGSGIRIAHEHFNFLLGVPGLVEARGPHFVRFCTVLETNTTEVTVAT